MMTFRLKQITETKFRIFNQRGDTIGSVCVDSPSEAEDLVRSWHGPVEGRPQALARVQAEPKASPVSSMVAAMMKHKRGLSPAAILRGC